MQETSSVAQLCDCSSEKSEVSCCSKCFSPNLQIKDCASFLFFLSGIHIVVKDDPLLSCFLSQSFHFMLFTAEVFVIYVHLPQRANMLTVKVSLP